MPIFGGEIKKVFEQISRRSDFSFENLEVDQDHIHCLIKSAPKISPLAIVRRLKQESTIYLWKNYESALRKHFWKERTFWSDGYFGGTIGNAGQEVIRKYIENQG